MKHTTFQSRRYILSRDRPEGLELVDEETGELVVLKPEQRSELGPITEVYLDVIPGLIHFPARPPSFLTDLRQRREQYLREARLKKRRGPKVHKGPAEPGVRVARAAKLSPAIVAAIAHLPPEVQANFLKTKKREKKG